MDGSRFDQLARELWEGGSRRRLLLRLSALPVLGGLASVLAEADAKQGKGKGKGKGKNDDKNDDDDVAGDKNKGKRRKKKCKKKKAKACDGKCGTVTVKCKTGKGKTKRKQVNCGSCACDPPCEACFICDEASETCVVDPEQVGDPCGSTGQVCQADGACECDADSCPGGSTCQVDGTCTTPCGGTGCFDGDSCEPGTSNDACGTDGETCEVCSGATPICTGGTCVAGPACDVCETGCAFTSVQDAIDDATAGDTITLCAGLFEEEITIDKNLTIIGAGQGSNEANNTIIRGSGADSVVTVTAGTVTLSRMRIRDGGGDSGGGVFNTAGADLTLDRCTIADNHIFFGGGGGVHNESGATLTMTDCSVTSNDNNGGNGVGVFNAGTMTVTDCTITDNGFNSQFGPQGGGIFIPSAAVLTVTGSTIADNVAARGGAVFNNGGTADFIDTEISGNSAPDGGIGGAFRTAGGTTTLTNCTVAENVADDQGGGIYNNGTFILIDSIVSGNDAAVDGGGIYNVDTVTLVNTAITGDNTAVDQGGGIYNSAGTVNIDDDSTVTGNTSNGGAGSGGGIFNEATVTCEATGTVTGNTPDQCVDFGAGTGCAGCN